MTPQEVFISKGFEVVETQANENRLLEFLKENYPQVISDNEIKWEELKTVLGLPVAEKVNGYGLNFVGRNVAKAKYAQKTDKELKYVGEYKDGSLIREFEDGSLKMEEYKAASNFKLQSSNLLLKGDNLDCLKILKSYYNGKIKCIYIDPPYNTTSDEFVYPDKFDKEEAEVLGLANISDSDFDRMEFSFRTKKSHNGWLSFMYPRLMLARDLLSKDGVIFISIDDNEQANLKLLCDEIFGEENFVAQITWERAYAPINLKKHFSESHDFILCYAKQIDNLVCYGLVRPDSTNSKYGNPDNDPRGLWRTDNLSVGPVIPEKVYEITTPSGRKVLPPKGRCWVYTKERYEEMIAENRIWFGVNGNNVPAPKRFLSEVKQGLTPMTIWKYTEVGHNQDSMRELSELFNGEKVFDYSKPVKLIKQIASLYTSEADIILDFFAGSGTTGHAVMQLNAEDGGNRKFILCQIDEPIKEDKPAYQFCVENNLPPVISSITIERLNRAGEKIIGRLMLEVGSWKSEDVIKMEEGSWKMEELSWKMEEGSWKMEDNKTTSNFKLQTSNSNIPVSINELIKNYGCPELSKTDSVAKSDVANQINLFNNTETSEGGDLLSYKPDETGSNINSFEYCGGTREKFNQGVHPFSNDSTRVESGIGNSIFSMQGNWVPCRYGYFGNDRPAKGNKQDAECPYKKTKECPITSSIFQLQSSNLNTGFKVFDLTDAPKLEIKEDGQIVIQNMDNDPFSRIYNIIFSLGIDAPTILPETVLENCMYKIGSHYYITNAAELDKEENKDLLSEAIKTGKVFIDGWTASINTTLQKYKEDVKVVF